MKTRVALGAALLLSALMLALAAGSADAAFPGKNGKIAFTSENSRGEIFVIDPDGNGRQRLRSGSSPSWSADGQKIVFVVSSGRTPQDFRQDLFVMDADGTNARRLTDTRGAYESSPSFFPDGQTVAFASYSEKKGSDIFKINVNGTGRTKLTDDPGFYEESVAVSPDGQKIAFSRYRNNSEIFVMGADGSDPVNLTKTSRVDEFGMDWAPNGRQLAFTSYRFFTPLGLAAEARQETAVAPEGLGVRLVARGAADSKAVESKESTAAPEDEPQESVEIAVINADGTGRRDLTATRAFDAAPAFAPSGSRIVFSRITFGPGQRDEKSELVVMRSDGANKRQITNSPRIFEYEADWQPLPPETAEID